MIGITSDVLKHTSILFFQGTVNFRFYRRKLPRFYNNYSFNAWVLLKKFCSLVFVFFILVIMTPEFCNTKNI
jgi:hypothetical protein